VTVRLLTDENIDGALVTGLQRVVEELDLVRVQDVGLRQAEDPAILAWAADARRVLVTLDAKTIPGFAADRVRSGLPMPGVFLLRRKTSLAVQLEALAVVAGATETEEWDTRVVYLPL